MKNKKTEEIKEQIIKLPLDDQYHIKNWLSGKFSYKVRSKGKTKKQISEEMSKVSLGKKL